MIYNFAKLIDQTEDFDNPVVKRLWVGDYWKDEVEQYFGVYDDGELIAYYTHEEQADKGMENRAKEYTTWNDEDRWEWVIGWPVNR
jgi:hypothetical protein